MFNDSLFSIHIMHIFIIFIFIQNIKEDSDTNPTQQKSPKTEFKQSRTGQLKV